MASFRKLQVVVNFNSDVSEELMEAARCLAKQRRGWSWGAVGDRKVGPGGVKTPRDRCLTDV